MKTIKAGQKPEPQKPWWLEVELSCDHCGWVGMLEEGDEKNQKLNILVLAARCIDGPRTITLDCPTCEQMIRWESRPGLMVAKDKETWKR